MGFTASLEEAGSRVSREQFQIRYFAANTDSGAGEPHNDKGPKPRYRAIETLGLACQPAITGENT
jgi:hypothetical protein